jgi:hypothetical protein
MDDEYDTEDDMIFDMIQIPLSKKMLLYNYKYDEYFYTFNNKIQRLETIKIRKKARIYYTVEEWKSKLVGFKRPPATKTTKGKTAIMNNFIGSIIDNAMLEIYQALQEGDEVVFSNQKDYFSIKFSIKKKIRNYEGISTVTGWFRPEIKIIDRISRLIYYYGRLNEKIYKFQLKKQTQRNARILYNSRNNIS